jgi:hypothetical protein
MIGLVASAVVGLVLVAVLVVFDAGLVVQAYERSASSTVAAVVIGTAAALGTVLAFAWYRSRVGRLGGTARRVLGWAGIAWAGLFVIAFVWTHPRHRDEFSTPLEVAVVSYCLIVVLVAVCLLPVAMLGFARPTNYGTRDRIRVWKVDDDDEPYFVAYCDCGWVGTAHDATDLEAQDKAFRDARDHGTNVAPEVEHPLG